MLALQVKYCCSVPSVGSRPQYLRFAQVFGLPRRQNSHLLDCQGSFPFYKIGQKRVLEMCESPYVAQVNPGSTATRCPTCLSFASEPISTIRPADSWPRSSSFETLGLFQLWVSEPQIPVEMTWTSTSFGPGGVMGRSWIARVRCETQAAALLVGIFRWPSGLESVFWFGNGT
jgi:hypothetical protein